MNDLRFKTLIPMPPRNTLPLILWITRRALKGCALVAVLGLATLSETQVSAAETNPEVAKRLTQIREQFQSAYDRDIGKAYASAVADLDVKYAGALDRALATATKEGKLDDALALRTEVQRLKDQQPLPAGDLETLPAALKLLRGTYRDAIEKLVTARDAKARPYYDRYDQLLAAYQKELIQAQRLDEAVQVKLQRDALVGLGTPVDTATEATGTTPPAEKSKLGESPAPKGGSPWRRAAEWVISLGGEVFVSQNGKTKSCKTSKDLPTGKFSVTIIKVGSLPVGKIVSDDDLTVLSGLRDLREATISCRGGVKGPGMEAFRGTPNLQLLKLQGVEIKDDHLAPLAGLKSLQSLEIASFDDGALKVYPKLTGAGMKHLSKLTNLSHASLPASMITPEAVAVLAQLPELRELVLGSGMNDESTPLLNALPKLETLIISAGVLTDEGLSKLTALTHLKMLRILVCDKVGGSGLVALKEAKGLRDLDLCFSQAPTMVDASLKTIVETFPALEGLGIGSKKVTQDGFHELTKLGALKRLSLNSFPQLTDDWLSTLEDLTNLEAIYLECKLLTDAGLVHLEGLRKLRTLTLTDTQVTDAALASLKKMKQLQRVEFRGTTPFSPDATKELRQALPNCTVVR